MLLALALLQVPPQVVRTVLQVELLWCLCLLWLSPLVLPALPPAHHLRLAQQLAPPLPALPPQREALQLAPPPTLPLLQREQALHPALTLLTPALCRAALHPVLAQPLAPPPPAPPQVARMLQPHLLELPVSCLSWSPLVPLSLEQRPPALPLLLGVLPLPLTQPPPLPAQPQEVRMALPLVVLQVLVVLPQALPLPPDRTPAPEMPTTPLQLPSLMCQ